MGVLTETAFKCGVLTEMAFKCGVLTETALKYGGTDGDGIEIWGY